MFVATEVLNALLVVNINDFVMILYLKNRSIVGASEIWSG